MLALSGRPERQRPLLRRTSKRRAPSVNPDRFACMAARGRELLDQASRHKAAAKRGGLYRQALITRSQPGKLSTGRQGYLSLAVSYRASGGRRVQAGGVTGSRRDRSERRRQHEESAAQPSGEYSRAAALSSGDAGNLSRWTPTRSAIDAPSFTNSMQERTRVA